MKKFIKNIIVATILLVTAFSAGTSFAASFDLDPGQSGTGFASINTCKQGCANIHNSISANIPNRGDSQEFYVFLDFRNSSSGFITHPYGHLSIPQSGTSSTVSMDASFTGGYASTVHDGVMVTNLPSSWEMEFVPGSDSYVQIPVHTLTNGKTCEEYYNKQFSYTGRQFTNPQTVSIPTDAQSSLSGLDYQYAHGWCQQGYVTYKIRVTNTESNSNPNPNPGQTVSVETHPATGITQTSAVLNGKVTDGNNLHTWFVYGTDTTSSPVCSQTVRKINLSGLYTNGDNFNAVLGSLQPGTQYYYRACASDGVHDAEGSIEIFSTHAARTWHWIAGSWGQCVNGIQTRTVRCVDDLGNEDVSQVNCDATTKPETTRSCSITSTLPEAQTEEETDITDDEATLNGKVKMNSIDDGLVFFVYGTNRTNVDRVDSFSSYDSLNALGSIEKVVVDNDNDTDSWRHYSRHITGLVPETEYYDRICVEYVYAQSHYLECGNVEKFVTNSTNGNNGNNGGNDDAVVETLAPQSIGKTVAKLCGDLVDNGGDSSILTWIEYRKTSESSYEKTDKKDRGEGMFCEVVRGLTPGTTYKYRACSEDGCGSTKYFTTSDDNVVVGEKPQVTTGVAYDIRAHSAKLPALYISNADRASIYFRYGRSRDLNKRTRSYTVYGDRGEVVHPFTNLKSDQRYCYQAVIETAYGEDEGAIRCFYTLKSTVVHNTNPRPRPVVTIVKDDKPDIDLEKLGLGLSLVQLDIDDNFDSVSKGQQISYIVRWKNISKLDLKDLDLNVEIPREIQILGASRGLVDVDRNSVYYTIDRLDAGEEGSMTVSGVVIDGTVGDALTASATLTFDNPVNRAKEDAIDYDVDTFVIPVAGVNLGAGSVFGLGNITFLGWLTILLGVFILFLIARWLYLEREDLRAQAYANYHRGYYPPASSDPYAHPRAPVREYRESIHDVPSQRDVERRNGNDDPGYKPYRPNR